MARIIDVIDHTNVGAGELAWREPQRGSGDWRMGSQVIVGESQAAVFVRGGQALDVLGPGRHTLSTANLPVLSSLIGLITSGRTPFTADVYFVNLRDLPQVGWGTNPPVVLETPGRGLGVVLLITHGIIDISIVDPLLFVKQYAVGRASLHLTDVKERIQAMLLSEIGEMLSRSGARSVMEANQLLGALEGAALAALADRFAAMGMRLKAFDAKPFTAKDVPLSELRNYIDLETYERVQRLNIAERAAENPGLGGGLAGAGVGLAIGQQMGNALNPEQGNLQRELMEQNRRMQEMMMDMMRRQQGGGEAAASAPTADAPAATGAPATPTTRAEIQALLDQLDAQLANGQLSETTYNRLVQRWEARLAELGG